MQLFGITRGGLTALGIAVFALWSCLMLESSARRHGERDARIVVATLRKLRQDSAPAISPEPWLRSRRPAAS